ncbi:MAG: VCBS repeat-containing protein [Candidatus Calescibacterium sp.]|nr:VCBS repeat-containing protein [Candidatus Calescibacterium sp.]
MSWNGQIKEVYSINLTNFIILPIFKPLGGDIDGDGKKEIILLGFFQKSTTNEITETLKDKIYVIGNNIVAIDISHITGDFHAPPVAEDINFDRKDEIIIPFLVEIYVIDGKGNVIWNFDKVGGEILSQPVVSDIDSDGKPEILFISRDGKIKVLNGEGKLISEYEVWKRDEIVEVGASSLALVDIDFDGRKEIIGWTDEVFMIRNGVKVWNFIVGGPKGDFEPPLVVNDDGDFKIVVTFANRIYTLKAGKVKK